MLYRTALCLLSVPLFAQIPFTQFVVFGDSLSDNGNFYIGTTLLGDPQPGPPMYATGEYTDGVNSVPPTSGPLGLWIEQLAAIMNLPIPQPYAKGTGGTNYAVASALTGTNPAFSPKKPNAAPYLTDQLNLFLAKNETPPVNALYAFWGGSNDIIAGVAPATAVSNIEGNISTLAAAGAKYFLWINESPLGEIPEYINTSSRSSLDAAAVTYNQAMTTAVAELNTAHAGITIITLDVYTLFLLAAQNPSLYGYTNVTSPAQGLSSVNPNTYLFWDTLHPTTTAHAYVAKAAANTIANMFVGPTGPPPPTISAVVSASSFGGFTSVAPGSWVEIYGSNLAPDTREWAGSDFNGSDAPTSLDGVEVTIGGQKAFIDYISSAVNGQINAQLPSNIVAGGPLQLTVNNGATTSSAYNIMVNATEPGLLAPTAFQVGGNQYVVAQHKDGSYVLPAGAIAGVNSSPAQPGEAVLIYGVGFGPVTPNIPAGEIVTEDNQLSLPFQMTFGQTPAQLKYDGLAPNYVGLYQFDVVVPSVPDNDLVPLTFNLGGTVGTQKLFAAVHQ